MTTPCPGPRPPARQHAALAPPWSRRRTAESLSRREPAGPRVRTAAVRTEHAREQRTVLTRKIINHPNLFKNEHVRGGRRRLGGSGGRTSDSGPQGLTSPTPGTELTWLNQRHRARQFRVLLTEDKHETIPPLREVCKQLHRYTPDLGRSSRMFYLMVLVTYSFSRISGQDYVETFVNTI